jgi:hypothetical protein
MEKITLNLGETLQLESEINGFTHPETGKQVFEGFVKQKLRIILKYELIEFSDFLIKERKKVESLRDDLIKKYGEEDGDGAIIVKMFDEVKDNDGNVVTSKLNENYLKFDEEYSKLLNTEKEIEYPLITKEDLNDAGKSNDDYRILFKLVKK